MNDYDGQQMVGIDLHRRRTVIVRKTQAGEHLDDVRIDNDPLTLAVQIAKAGEAPRGGVGGDIRLVLGRRRACQDAGAVVHLAHPLGVKGFAYRRVKNDVRDASDLADLLRMGRLPEAWIAPPAMRELREAVRHRSQARRAAVRTKAAVHGVSAKRRACVPMSDLFGMPGSSSSPICA